MDANRREWVFAVEARAGMGSSFRGNDVVAERDAMRRGGLRHRIEAIWSLGGTDGGAEHRDQAGGGAPMNANG